jgi:hypothetical protein
MAEVRVYQPGKSGLQQANKAKLQQNSPSYLMGYFCTKYEEKKTL